MWLKLLAFNTFLHCIWKLINLLDHCYFNSLAHQLIKKPRLSCRHWFSKRFVTASSPHLPKKTNWICFQLYTLKQPLWSCLWYPDLPSVQFSRSVVSNSLQPHESQHARPPCPSQQTPRVYSNSCPSSQWCHPAISSSVIPFFSCPQSLPAPGSFSNDLP